MTSSAEQVVDTILNGLNFLDRKMLVQLEAQLRVAEGLPESCQLVQQILGDVLTLPLPQQCAEFVIDGEAHAVVHRFAVARQCRR